MTNRERANTARFALGTFTILTYARRNTEELGAPTVDDGIAGNRLAADDDSDIQTAVADLICDLGHYCDAIGLDYELMLDRAAMHYHAERTLGWDEEE